MHIVTSASVCNVLYVQMYSTLYLWHFVSPLKVAYLYRDGLETITGEVELGQGEDLTHTFREHTQTVVTQVQALQLRKPEGRQNKL